MGVTRSAILPRLECHRRRGRASCVKRFPVAQLDSVGGLDNDSPGISSWIASFRSMTWKNLGVARSTTLPSVTTA
mgnify:FL=1